MKPSRLLYLSPHQMTAWRWHAGELRSEGVFAAGPDGHRGFADYLAQHRDCVFAVLANVSEEGFQIETIPFLRGADRQAVIGRKLTQLFFNAPLTAFLSLGYEKSTRKDERLMLAALTNNDFLAPWLDALAGAGVALAGIYSLPLLAPTLLRKLQLGAEQCLLLTVQDQSIRQSYFEKGELHFSRLAPLHDSSIVGIAQTFSGEAQKLQQYLASQRLIGREQPITVHLLAHANARKAIQASCASTATIRYNFLSIEDCGKKTKLKSLPSDSHCEPLFLNLLAGTPPRIQFARDTQRKAYHLRQTSSLLKWVGAFALTGCLAVSGTLLFDSYKINAERAALGSEAGLSRQRYDDIVKTFPPIPTNNETLRRVIDRYAELERKAASPTGLYLEISRALQAAPAAELDRIEWKVGGAGSAASPATGQNLAASVVPGDSEAAIVHGMLRLGSNANARQMLRAFDNLVEALKANPKLRVEVLQRPFDIESGKSLKGGDTTLESNMPRAFSLQIIRTLAP
jgi:hypothetical protein